MRIIASRLVDLADQSSLNQFVTWYHWDEEELNQRSLELLQSTNETRWSKEDMVAIDDTLLPKTVENIPRAEVLEPQLPPLRLQSMPSYKPLL